MLIQTEASAQSLVCCIDAVIMATSVGRKRRISDASLNDARRIQEPLSRHRFLSPPDDDPNNNRVKRRRYQDDIDSEEFKQLALAPPTPDEYETTCYSQTNAMLHDAFMQRQRQKLVQGMPIPSQASDASDNQSLNSSTTSFHPPLAVESSMASSHSPLAVERMLVEQRYASWNSILGTHVVGREQEYAQGQEMENRPP